jgi:hypothetical protein
MYDETQFVLDILTPVGLVIAILAALVVIGVALHYLFKGLEWCREWCIRNYQRRQRRKDYWAKKPNPWASSPPPAPPPPPVRIPPARTPRYVRQEQEFAERSERPPRSPVRLLYSAAFERLTDGELEQIRSTAPDVIPRLHRAALLLSLSRTNEAESILIVVRGILRRSFGDGRFWLEAIVISDLAALDHHANKAEDAAMQFERATAIAAPWLDRYPWLRYMVTARRLIHK